MAYTDVHGQASPIYCPTGFPARQDIIPPFVYNSIQLIFWTSKVLFQRSLQTIVTTTSGMNVGMNVNEGEMSNRHWVSLPIAMLVRLVCLSITGCAPSQKAASLTAERTAEA